MKVRCELCGRPAVSYRCVDLCVGVVYTCKDCRFPRVKELKLVKPASQGELPALRVGEVDTIKDERLVRSPPVLVLVRAPAADDAASGEWKLRGEHKARFRLRRMGDRS